MGNHHPGFDPFAGLTGSYLAGGTQSTLSSFSGVVSSLAHTSAQGIYQPLQALCQVDEVGAT